MLYEFDPVRFSTAENEWLLDNIGKPTVVAMRDGRQGVNPKAVRPVIDRIHELSELEKHENLKWVGVERIKQSIQTWLTQNKKWAADAKMSRRAPRWPSLYSFDARGRAHRSAPDSDSGIVKTYFGPAGERLPFAVDLIPDHSDTWQPPVFTEQSMDPQLYVNSESHRIECKVPVGDSFCGHTESYKESSRASYNAARARMSKHLRKATESVEAHRELHTNEFGG
jgi:hypothetical protein